jgi:dihydroneopterin aldolase
MPAHSQIEQRDLVIPASIGTYGPDDVVPEAHILDLTLTISADLVVILEDRMPLVFDYDPLIARIDALARGGHVNTQERLMTLIAQACAAEPAVEEVELCLCKRPVLGGSGTLGVRLMLDRDAMAGLRT